MSSAQLVQAHVQSLQQAQSVSLRLQHSVRLLHMSSLDFAQSIADALAENPFLDSELDDDGGGAELPPTLLALADEQPTDSVSPPDVDAAASHDAPADDHAAADQADHADLADDSADEWQQASADERGDDDGEHMPGAGADDWAVTGSGMAPGDGFSAVDLAAQSTSLVAHLRGQLYLLDLPPRDMALAQALVEMLDDDGYLRADPMELTLQPLGDEGDADVGERTADADADDDTAAFATAAEVQIALRRVQSLDPAGVGARSVQECLLLQLGDVSCPTQRALVRDILQQHLPRLAARDLQGMVGLLGRPLAEVEAACARIRRMQPRPGWRFGANTAAYVVPDVVVRRVRDGNHKLVWRALLNPAVVPRVRMNRHLVDLYRQSRGNAGNGLAGHLQLARWTLKNVEQRFCTIVAVAQAIVDRQRLFLDYGELAMKPLGLREIADAVGVHESTVSRVTSNKYMSTPGGVFELKHFFSRAMVMPGGNAFSATAIRGLLRELIDAEPAHRPLTDVDLAEQLRLQGLPVARRTVTKYRQALRIEPAASRRSG